jgi:hypothetical protein
MMHEVTTCCCGRLVYHAGAYRASRRVYHHTLETDALIGTAYDKLRNFAIDCFRKSIPSGRFLA